ncbi:MAG: hypothetical protein HRT89_23145, partial [Lentisphaeria bacterium]|nr:hypothetical protein [Lentisphaeria bacterium]NQZ70957.1 hypothetical protein [Lentisphaeria bacterium]
MIWDEHAYLMVDSAIIAQEEGTSMVREESFKHADNPIIHADRKEFFLGQPGYRVWVLCVAREGGVYRMWYRFQLAAT